MITGAIVSAVLSCLDAIFSLLPSYTITPPTDTGVWGEIGDLNGIIPLGTVTTLLLMTVALIIILRVWDFGVFVFHQFWGSD